MCLTIDNLNRDPGKVAQTEATSKAAHMWSTNSYEATGGSKLHRSLVLELHLRVCVYCQGRQMSCELTRKIEGKSEISLILNTPFHT